MYLDHIDDSYRHNMPKLDIWENFLFFLNSPKRSFNPVLVCNNNYMSILHCLAGKCDDHMGKFLVPVF